MGTFISRRPSPAASAVAAGLVLAVAMGIGRFAYTGMYPLMVRDGVLTVASGSLAASANYAGYLLGALAVSRTQAAGSAYLCRAGLVVTVLSLAALALPAPIWVLCGLRFAAGAGSAVAMVSGAAWLFHVINHPDGAPILFAGVGVGIIASAELIALGNVMGMHSATLWLVLAAGAAALTLLVWRPLSAPANPPAAAAAPPAAGRHLPPLGPWQLLASYGLAGFGYIVTATYLPLFVREILGNIDPIHLWAAFGLGAAPSCFLWHALNRRLGSRRALMLNLLVQAVGVILPVASPSIAGDLASAVLVGGTFMGTVTIVMPAARAVASRVRFNILAGLTAAYGIGQIAGPLLSNPLYAYGHSFNLPLAASCFALIVAAALCLLRPGTVRPQADQGSEAVPSRVILGPR